MKERILKKNLILFLQINFLKLNLLLLYLIIAFSGKSALSQEKEFVLGFSGTPHQTCSFIDTNLYCPYWLHYHWFDEFKLNLWQGWNAGSNLQYHLTSLDSLEHYGMQGYYQPDLVVEGLLGQLQMQRRPGICKPEPSRMRQLDPLRSLQTVVLMLCVTLEPNKWE